MAMGIFAAIIAVTTGYTRRPRQLSLLVLGLFLIHSLWLTAGMWWSDAPHAAWMAAVRTYGGLTTLTLGMCLLTGWASRMVFRALLLVASLTLVAFVMIWAATHPAGVVSLFVGNPGSAALALPGGGPEITAALALALIWPLLWQASDPKSPHFSVVWLWQPCSASSLSAFLLNPVLPGSAWVRQQCWGWPSSRVACACSCALWCGRNDGVGLSGAQRLRRQARRLLAPNPSSSS